MQQLALDALREREWELSQLVNLVPGHLWRLRPDGEPTFFNQRMVDYLGLDVIDTSRSGKTRLQVVIDNLVHADDAAAFSARLRKCLATGESFSMRYRLRRADGSYRWMSSRAESQRDQRGRIVQWYGFSQDVEHDVQSAWQSPNSLAYDTIQSLAAIVTSAQAADAWLSADPPNIERARKSAVRIVSDALAAAGTTSCTRWELGAAAAKNGSSDKKVD